MDSGWVWEGCQTPITSISSCDSWHLFAGDNDGDACVHSSKSESDAREHNSGSQSNMDEYNDASQSDAREHDSAS